MKDFRHGDTSSASASSHRLRGVRGAQDSAERASAGGQLEQKEEGI
jgi:hypothetical protein